MKYWLWLIFALYTFLLLPGSHKLNAQDFAEDQLMQRARQEFQDGKYADAEHDFREIVKGNPSNFGAQLFLGQSLFRQQKFAEAVGPFEKARQLETEGQKLTSDQHHILIDQLVISLGASGDLKKAHTLLDDAIRQDPDYPLNYYNLACAYAEEGDKAKMLANLSTAFRHKDHILKGEQMPDPRSDDSFQKYLRDNDFIKLMKQIGYN